MRAGRPLRLATATAVATLLVAAGGASAQRAVTGTPGDDELTGGPGPDRIAGGDGLDRIAAGAGDDIVDALDGGATDRIDCGEGEDVVFADPGDRTEGCERIVRAAGIGSTTLRLRVAHVFVTLSCPEGAAPCSGTLHLRSTAGVTLATGRYGVAPGDDRGAARMRATPAFRKAVRTRKRVFGSLFVSPTGRRASAGRTVSVRS